MQDSHVQLCYVDKYPAPPISDLHIDLRGRWDNPGGLKSLGANCW